MPCIVSRRRASPARCPVRIRSSGGCPNGRVACAAGTARRRACRASARRCSVRRRVPARGTASRRDRAAPARRTSVRSAAARHVRRHAVPGRRSGRGSAARRTSAVPCVCRPISSCRRSGRPWGRRVAGPGPAIKRRRSDCVPTFRRLCLSHRYSPFTRTGAMDQVRQDLRHAARRLLRRPGFAAIAILTLGLGIGANVAIYTVVRAVLLEPLPYAEADRLALVVNLRKGVLEGGWISEPEALEVREGVSSFENVAYWTSGAANVASGAGDPERVVTARVTAGLFDVLAVPAAAGRYFAADEWRRGGPPVVLTSGGGIAAIGIGVGVAGALALSRLMSGLVYGVPALDPVTYLVVPAIL